MGRIINPYFYVPPPSGGDPYFANVPVLFHFDVLVGSGPARPQNFGFDTTLWQLPGASTINTSSPMYGAGDVMSIGNGCALPDGVSANFVIGTGDYTVEWSTLTASPSQTAVMAAWGAALPEIFMQGGVMGYYDGAISITSGVAVATSTRQRWAISRVSSVTRLFCEGSQTGADHPDTHNFTSNNFAIGVDTINGFPYTGRMDEFRLTIGIGRYDASGYTPSALPFPNHV